MAESDLDHVLTAKYARPSVPTAAFRIVVVEGPDVGVECTIDGALPSRAHIGTGPTCALKLTDRHVSRRHLVLDPIGNLLALSDLRSTNGTLVNGVRVVEGSLAGGEIVRIGATTLRVECIGAGASVAPGAELVRFGRALGVSVEMRKVFALAHRLANARVPVLVEGDTGTGKELLAECLHEQGPRASQPFVVFDSSAFSSLVEATLFGCEAGMIPGVRASEARAGVFEQAHGGTLLIDEPSALDLEVQRSLARVIESGTVRRIGSAEARAFDVRIVVTSSTDLDKAVDDGRLREDLFYRLAVTRVELPPLRRRPEDIALLATHFWTTLGGNGAPPPELLARFEGHSWPGNVRELQNAVARHLATGEMLRDRSKVSSDPAVESFAKILEEDLPMPKARQRCIAEFERAYLARVLDKHGGNVTRAASASGIAHRYFQSLKAKYAR